MGLFQSKHANTLTLFLDVGNEIDDEQLALYIEKCQELILQGWNIEIVFCGPGKMTDLASMRRWITEFKFPGVLQGGTDVETANVVPHPITSNLTYTTHEEFISRTAHATQTDYALVCASLKGWSGANFTVTKMLLFQGDIEDTKDADGNVVSPKGLNAVGSESFIANMKNKLGKRFVVVPSARCAEMRPTARYLKSLPKHFKNATAEAGFKLMVGRIAPGIVIPTGAELSKKIAAGLVNPSRGRAANFKAMVSFMALLDVNMETDFEPPISSGLKTRSGNTTGESKKSGQYYDLHTTAICEQLAINYFLAIYEVDELTDKIWFNDATPDGTLVRKEYDWDRENTLKNLTLVHIAIDHICPGIWENKKLPFYSNFTLETKDADLQKLRGIYIDNLDKVEDDTQIGFLNPSYDLYVGYVFMYKVQLGLADASEDSLDYALTKATPVEVFKAVSLPMG
jgi:hypothetical protein